MPLFVCDFCHCVENTALGNYWCRNDKTMWKAEYVGKALCSECAPTEFKGGEKAASGKWHGRFPKKKVTEAELRGEKDEEQGKFIYVPASLLSRKGQ